MVEASPNDKRRDCARVVTGLSLLLLVLLPVAWAAPLLRAGLLPLFGLSEISVLSGIASLWVDDKLLASVVALFALVAPVAKLVGIMALVRGSTRPALLRIVALLGRLAMADIFLVALYITIIKGVGIGRVEVGWGLYLFTGCVLGQLALGWLAHKCGHQRDAGLAGRPGMS